MILMRSFHLRFSQFLLNLHIAINKCLYSFQKFQLYYFLKKQGKIILSFYWKRMEVKFIKIINVTVFIYNKLNFKFQMTVVGQRIIRQEEQKLVKKIKNYIYDPSQIVGSGFSSNVFKGVNQLNQQTIAIKVLELSKIQSQVQKYLLNNQINALRALTHPHILRTIEILMTKNNVYIMTEFCENGDLQQFVRKQTRLSQLDALHIIRDVVDGYLAIEQKKIVHRDLKTANIFLTNKGARIADFGFCQFLNETKKPQLFYNVGSPAYMSPQSYRQNIYSAKSDIWSIGIILYEMLVGQTPDKNLTYSEMSNNLMMGRINSGPNEQIRQILSLCFKKELKQRISPYNLLELIKKQIARLQGPKQRPQTVVPVYSNQISNQQIKIGSSNVSQTVAPSEISLRNSHNRHMISSTLPQNQPIQNQIRGQSPFKNNRFNGVMITQRKNDSSPMKHIQRRFSKQQQNLRINGGQINKIKCFTQMLLFLYRLLNYLGEVNIESNNFMRLILFRHRNHLQSSIQRIVHEDKLDKNTYQPLKQFHYLKSRFDEAYLQKQVQQSNSSLPNHIIFKLNELSNHLFAQSKSLSTYCYLTLETAKDCQRLLNMPITDQNQISKIGYSLDYLLLHYEVLQLYVRGQSMQLISQEIMQLPVLLKDQPRKLTQNHIILIKYKLKTLNDQFELWNSEPLFEKRGSDDISGYKQLNEIPERKTLLQNGFF